MKNNPTYLSSTQYRSDIDGLRAIAVLAVVGFHAFPHLFKSGFVGVDIFFVISGFLISTILFKNLEKETFSFIEFYGKRIKRIFPALLLVFIFCIACGWFILFPDEYKQLGKHIAGGAGFISNFLLWHEAGYFDKVAETKPLLHLWSLGIEEQFYIVWPLLLWAGWKKHLNLCWLIIALISLSFILNIQKIHSDAMAVFYSPQTRFWELLSGSLLAWLMLYKQPTFAEAKKRIINWLTPLRSQKKPALNPIILNHAFSFLGFLLIEYCIYNLTKIAFPGAWALLPILGTVFIISAGSQAWINRIILSNRIIIWFGLISFPLYLWHWPLLSFARIIEDDKPNQKIRIAAVLIAIFLAWLTYQFIEKPIRFNKKFSKTKLALLGLFMVVIGYMGLSIYKYQGFSDRFKNLTQLNTLVTLIDHPYPTVKDYDCKTLLSDFNQFTFDGGCRLSKNRLPEVIFIGDSHTAHYYHAVVKNFSTNSVMMIVQTSCLPFASDSLLQGKCKEKYKAVLSFLKSNQSIKKVYLSGYWAYLMSGGFSETGTHWRHAKPLTPEAAQSFQKNGKHFIKSILATKKEIIFLKDIPDLDFNIKLCFKTRAVQLSQRSNKECWLDFSAYSQRVADYDNVINTLLAKFPQLKIYDPRPLFCQQGKCIVQDTSLPYYFNGDHLNHYGADFVIKDLLYQTQSHHA